MSITKSHFVLVDYENTQKLDLERFTGQQVKVIIFAGVNQKTVPLSLLRSAVQSKVLHDVIQTEKTGSNALDLVIASHVGELVINHPGTAIHIVSRDKGFDALVAHLRSKGTTAERVDVFTELGALPKVTKTAASTQQVANEPVTLVKQHLKRAANNRPRTLTKLKAALGTHFRKVFKASELDRLVLQLKTKGIISVGPNNRLTYTFD